MIISGHPEQGLQKHQHQAYSAVTKAFETDNRAAVVIPTGCGKSFIALQLMQDNKDKNILFLAPTNAIKDQMYGYIAKYIVGEEPTSKIPAKKIAKEHFPNLKIILYPTLLRMKSEMMESLNPDIIIMDELHRTGAEQWGTKIETLLKKNPNAKVLGLTATPDRMDDKNVVDNLFDGKIDYEVTLVEAIRRGIVTPPSYVKCDYALRDELESIKIVIEQCDNEQTKRELQERFDKMRRIVEQADGIPELFEKHMVKKDGKYIVFCKDKQHMDELMGMVGTWFANIDLQPEIYCVYSGEGYSARENEKTIKRFETAKSEHLKLLFSLNMLNEGLHVEDISGVIMLRPTDSRIIYLQQLGRVLSSDRTREKTIVFDLVNNYLKNNLDREVNAKNKGEIIGRETQDRSERREWTGETEREDIDIFRIQGETKEFLTLLEELYGISGRSAYLTNALEIKRWMQERQTTKPPSQTGKDEEERRLGNALRTIRKYLIKPYLILDTEEEREQYRERHPELQEVMSIVNEIDANNISRFLVNAREITQWMKERKTAKPPSEYSKDKEEKKLANALKGIKTYLIKPYLKLKTEEERERYREEHPELEEVMQIVNEIDGNKSSFLRNSREIKIWMKDKKTTKPPSGAARDKEEKRLGLALKSIRGRLINPYISLVTEEERERYREEHPELEEVMQIVEEIDRNNIPVKLMQAREIKKWMEERKTTNIPNKRSKDEEEKRLGAALSMIKEGLIKPYLRLKTEEEREQYKKEHPELEEVMQIIIQIDNQRGSTKKQELASLIERDIKITTMLQESKKLEISYEQALEQQVGGNSMVGDTHDEK